MDSITYRQWRPPQSPLRIEFAAKLLEELKPDPTCVETTGVLYGARRGQEVRVVSSAHAKSHADKPVGIYVARIRGEVFLTESNLELFEKRRVPVALVIAGGKAGFFVRSGDGAFESVRSYEEFAVQEAPESAASKPRQRAPGIHLRAWSWFLGALHWARPRTIRLNRAWTGGLALAIALPLAALAYLHPARPTPAPVALQLREQSGQIQISWGAGQAGVLEIRDGRERTVVPVFPDQSNITYARRGAEVEVSLVRVEPASPETGKELTRTETGRFLGPPPPLSQESLLHARITQLRADGRRLRAALDRQRARAQKLDVQIARMTGDRN